MSCTICHASARHLFLFSLPPRPYLPAQPRGAVGGESGVGGDALRDARFHVCEDPEFSGYPCIEFSSRLEPVRHCGYLKATRMFGKCFVLLSLMRDCLEAIHADNLPFAVKLKKSVLGRKPSMRFLEIEVLHQFECSFDCHDYFRPKSALLPRTVLARRLSTLSTSSFSIRDHCPFWPISEHLECHP